MADGNTADGRSSANNDQHGQPARQGQPQGQPQGSGGRQGRQQGGAPAGNGRGGNAPQSQSSDQPPVPDDPQPASQESYEQEVTETDWVHAPEGDEWFEVRTIPVLTLLRTAKRYDMLEMLDAEDDFDFEGAMKDGRWDGFIEELVVPNVERPQVYWEETDHLPDDVLRTIEVDGEPETVVRQGASGVFDLGVMDPADIFELINGMAGVTQDELQERMDDRFPQ